MSKVLTFLTKIVLPNRRIFLRRKLPAKLLDFLQAPKTLTWTHVKRCFLHIYLFCYAPITAAAIQMLACVDTCTTGTECEQIKGCQNTIQPSGCVRSGPCLFNASVSAQVLGIDYGITCSSDQYWQGATTAIATLTLFTFLVPLFLVIRVRSAIRRRDASLELRVCRVSASCIPSCPHFLQHSKEQNCEAVR